MFSPTTTVPILIDQDVDCDVSIPTAVKFEATSLWSQHWFNFVEPVGLLGCYCSFYMPCEQLQVSKTLNECSQPEPGFINNKKLLISLKSSPLPHLLFTTTPLSPLSFASLLSTFDPRTCTKKVLLLCWTLWTILARWSVDRHHLFPQQPGLECHAAGLHWVCALSAFNSLGSILLSIISQASFMLLPVFLWYWK